MLQTDSSHGPANNSALVHEVLPNRDGLFDDAPAVTAGLAWLYKRSLDRRRRYINQIAKLYAQFREERRDIISDRTLRRLQAFREKQRATAYGLSDIQPGRSYTAEMRDAKIAAADEASKIMARARVDKDRLRRLYEKTAKRSHAILERSFRPVRNIVAAPVSEGPKALHDTPDAFVKTPPFDSVALSHYFQCEDGVYSWQFGAEIIENPFKYITGKLFHQSQWENYSAGYVDTFVLNARASVGFRYTPPAPGPRQIWVKVFVETSRADVWLDDEFDFSYHFTYFKSRFEIDVDKLPGKQGATEFFEAKVAGEPDDEWRHETLIPDNTEFWLPFTVNFPPDDVFIWIAAQNIHNTGLGDVSIDATMTVRYRIEEVVIV